MMRHLKCFYLAVLLFTIFFFYRYNVTNFSKKSILPDTVRNTTSYVNVGVVACGQRFHETISMIKSALIFNKETPLNFIIFCESHLTHLFQNRLEDWQKALGYTFKFSLRDLEFPSKNSLEWRNLFKPCAAQRLFLPSLLNTEDSLIYVDTDVIFLSPISEIFNIFSKFNASQIAALAAEHEDVHMSWYSRFARHPFYGNTGLNSGVMLMNLTRMREFDWEAKILPLYDEYKLKLTWGDQDIINILFYFNPDKLFMIPCTYNYRPDHCMYTEVCNVNDTGIKVIHGNRGYFHSMKQPLFKYIFDKLEHYDLNTSFHNNFYLPLEEAFRSSNNTNSNCGKLSQGILNRIKLYHNQNTIHQEERDNRNSFLYDFNNNKTKN